MHMAALQASSAETRTLMCVLTCTCRLCLHADGRPPRTFTAETRTHTCVCANMYLSPVPACRWPPSAHAQLKHAHSCVCANMYLSPVPACRWLPFEHVHSWSISSKLSRSKHITVGLQWGVLLLRMAMPPRWMMTSC